jgi:hypothetical protein
MLSPIEKPAMHHERERKGRKTQAGKQHHYVKTTEIRCE